jgi:ABC-2 type transport system permease protein
MLAMALSMQKSMSARGSAFEQKLAAMPREMLLAFGLERPNLSDAVGYLAANASLFTIIGALYAALLGAQLATRESSQRMGELLLTQPVSRSTVLLAKVAAGLACVLGFDLAMLVGGWLAYGGAGVAVANRAAFVSVFAGAALIHGALFALSLLASVSVSRPRTASSLATGLAFGLYGASVISRVSDRLAPLGRLSPFTYADAGAIAAHGGLEPKASALLLFTVVLVAVAQVRFERRDIDA